MTLRIFNHHNHSELTAISDASGFGHAFGGTIEEHGFRVTTRRGVSFMNRAFAILARQASDLVVTDLPRCHLLYCLDLRDERLGVSIPNVKKLPLIYGFHYVSIGGEFSYHVPNDKTIDVITHGAKDFRESFPSTNFPRYFARSAVSFAQRIVDVASAPDALNYQGVFGLQELSDSEMKRAISIAKNEQLVEFDDFRRNVDDEWDDDSILNAMGRRPFYHAAPSKTCTNPNCTVPINEEYTKIFGRSIRYDSRRVFALHEPELNDRIGVSWQVLYQICEYCKIISVTNQCD